jgi:hypothetical protein
MMSAEDVDITIDTIAREHRVVPAATLICYGLLRIAEALERIATAKEVAAGLRPAKGPE